VAGLTSALLLSENAIYDITVVAKHMPGDFDIEYASCVSPSPSVLPPLVLAPCCGPFSPQLVPAFESLEPGVLT